MINNVVEIVKNALIEAGSSFRKDKVEIYKQFILNEKNENSKWALETILENAQVACNNKSPLCDDTGIPHIVLEIGPNISLTGDILFDIKKGIAEGLKALPGRPMAIVGNDYERIGQLKGISPNSEDVESAPFLIRYVDENVLRVNILMFGGGPAIRAKTYRIFHKHNSDIVINEIVDWAKQAAAELGCTPCTLGIGIGRSHFEATSLMLEALVDGRYDQQNELEQQITEKVNGSNVGPLGLGGSSTVLATFLKIGPQRSSGVRIVCVRPCCCFEPRIACVNLIND